MEIRLFNMLDYDSVYELWKNTPGMGMRSLDDSRDGIQRFSERNPKTSFVAFDGNVIAGVVFCGHDGRRGYIYHACVSEEYRGRSLGRELIASALSTLRDEGINKAALVCFNQTKPVMASGIIWDGKKEKISITITFH